MTRVTRIAMIASAIINRIQSGNEDEEAAVGLVVALVVASERMVTVLALGLDTKSSPLAESYAISSGPGPADFVAITLLVASEIIEVLLELGVTT